MTPLRVFWTAICKWSPLTASCFSAIRGLVRVGLRVAPLKERRRIRCTMQVLLLPVDAVASSMASFDLFSRISVGARCATNIGAAVWKRISVYGFFFIYIFFFYFYRTFVFLPRARRSVLFLRRRPKLIKNNRTQYLAGKYTVFYNREIHLLYVHNKFLYIKVHLTQIITCHVPLYIKISNPWINFYSSVLSTINYKVNSP